MHPALDLVAARFRRWQSALRAGNRGLLDTHAWIWWLRGSAGGSQLSARETAALDALPLDQRPALCDISLWETLVRFGFGGDARGPGPPATRPPVGSLACLGLPGGRSPAHHRSGRGWSDVSNLPRRSRRCPLPFTGTRRIDSSSPRPAFTGCHCFPATARFSGRGWVV